MKRQLNETTKTQHEPAKLAREGGAGGAKRGRTMQRFTATVASLVMLLGVANYAAAKGGLQPPAPGGVGCSKAINLVASPAGVAIAAQGKARVNAFLNNGVLVQKFVV